MKTLKHTFLAAAAYGKRLPAKKLRSGLFVVAAFAGLAGLIALTDPPKSAAGPGPSNVIVVNKTFGGPNLPVEGNVGISGTPNVNVSSMPAISGTVGIDSLNNTVKIGSTVPLSVVPGPGTTPFSHADTLTLGVGNLTVYGTPFTPSMTKTLVIDQISWFGSVSTGQKLSADIVCTTGGNTVGYSVQFESFGPDPVTAGHDQVTGTVPLRIYCDANSLVEVNARRSSSTDANMSFNYGNSYTLSGYLLP